MKSRISCFNAGVCRNLLRRCWPLWVGWFVLLLFLLPVQLAKASFWGEETLAQSLQRLTLSSGQDMVLISFFMGIVTAMVVFGYLYNPRSCGLMHSLPLRRETLFFTAWLTGFLPMLAAELLTALLTGALYLGEGLPLGDLLSWLLMAVCSNLCFYGIAVFCAMLTGSLLILPVAYLALNLAAWAAEDCLRAVLRALVYGVSTQGDEWFTWLAPVVWLDRRVYVQRLEDSGFWQVTGLGWLLLYAGLGLLLSALALQLYRKRNMECAGDTVAFPVLKPIFRYCMAVGGALVFTSSVYSLLLGGSFHGRKAAFLILALLLLGAGLGWYIAEMLIRRTVRVFPGRWKGLAAVCAILCLLTLAAEFDLTGFERRVPDPEQVEVVYGYAQRNWTVREPENIREVTEIHRDLVDHKAQHESDIHYYGTWVMLSYVMKDGSSLERSYYIKRYEVEEPGDVDRLEALLNRPELMEQRHSLRIPVTEKTFYAAQLSWSWVDEHQREQYESLNLSQEEALDFYAHAVLPDLRDHCLGRVWLRADGERLETGSNVSFHMELVRPGPDGPGGAEEFDSLDLEIDMDSAACLAWIRENTEIPVFPQRQLLQEAAPAPAVSERAAP